LIPELRNAVKIAIGHEATMLLQVAATQMEIGSSTSAYLEKMSNRFIQSRTKRHDSISIRDRKALSTISRPEYGGC
jgi:hypothetical protein